MTTALVLSIVLIPAATALGQKSDGLYVGTKTYVTATPETRAAIPEADALPDAPGIPGQQQSLGNSTPSGNKSDPAEGKVSQEGKQTKRILYIIPNFRSVSADQQLPPQTVKEKFRTGTLDSVDYSSFLFVAIQSGIAQARNSTPEFHQGAAGYGRYYWHTFADYVDENLWTESLLPTILHQDSRYYTLGRGGFSKRLTYSFSRVAITRTDSGHQTFNASEIFGAGVASGISSLYYPSRERSFTKTYQLWLTNLAIDGGTFVFKEFWPDINNKFFHQKD
jgi:hypothetical protein